MIAYKFRPSDHVYDGSVELPDAPFIPVHHTREAPPQKEGYHAVMRSGWVLVEGDAPAEVVIQPDYSGQIREQRNRLLAESDWTQVADAPVDQAAWAAYRQALRDVTEQPGFPLSVEWPEQPGR